MGGGKTTSGWGEVRPLVGGGGGKTTSGWGGGKTTSGD